MTLGDSVPRDCSTLQHTATHCNTLQHDREILNSHLAIYFTTWSHWNILVSSCSKMELSVSIEKFSAVISLFILLWHWEILFLATATHCNTLQHSATHCNTHRNTLPHDRKILNIHLAIYFTIWNATERSRAGPEISSISTEILKS